MSVAAAWHRFRDDEPGCRFRDLHQRLRQRGRAVQLGVLLVGLVLIAAGIAFCFLPGPGSIAIVLGLGMVAGASRWMAAQLDDAESNLRAWRNERG